MRRGEGIRCLALALTHDIREVTLYAAEGAGRFLWTADPDLASSCVAALALCARLLDAAPPPKSSKPLLPELLRSSAVGAGFDRPRSLFFSPPSSRLCSRAFADRLRETPRAVDASTHSPNLSGRFSQPFAQQFFSRIAAAVVGWWHSSRSNRRHDHGPSDLTDTCINHLCRFALQLPPVTAVAICQPLIDAVESDPSEVAGFLRDLIIAEDQMHAGDTFWTLWQTMADRIATASWLPHLPSGYSSGEKPVRFIFLGVPWNEGVRHWPSLEGYADRIHALFDRLPPSAVTLQAYARFLYHIGERSLPDAFKVIDGGLRRGDPRAMLVDSNTRFYIETLLQRFVYSCPVQLKANPDLRGSVLHLLDELIESGSSIAYRMRDDFVTPLPLPLAATFQSSAADVIDQDTIPGDGSPLKPP